MFLIILTTPEAVMVSIVGVPEGFSVWSAVPEAVTVSIDGVPEALEMLRTKRGDPERIVKGLVARRVSDAVEGATPDGKPGPRRPARGRRPGNPEVPVARRSPIPQIAVKPTRETQGAHSWRMTFSSSMTKPTFEC